MTVFEKLKCEFVNYIPWMTNIATGHFWHLDPEAREEAVQNTLVLVWRRFHALIAKGRAGDLGILQSVLWYSIKQTRAGRRAEGDSRARDTFKYAQKGRIRFERVNLDNFVSTDTPVPDHVSFRLDVPAFLATLTDRQRRMAEALMTGDGTLSVANQFGITASAVSQFRNRFKEQFQAFMTV
jgi:hypothetical protein